MKLCTNVLLLLSFSCLFSQTKIDSLKQVISTSDNDSLKIETYLRIANAYLRKDYDKAILNLKEAEALALATNSKIGLAKFKFRMGNAQRMKNDFVLADKNYAEALTLFTELKDSLNRGFVLVDRARLYQVQSKFDVAIPLYLEAIPIFRRVDKKDSEARVHNFLGGLFRTLGQNEKSIEHYKIALSLVREINFTPGISACLTNLGSVYNDLGDYHQAERYFKEALPLKETAGDKLGASRVFNNLGKLNANQENYTISNDYFRKAHELSAEIGDKNLSIAIEHGLAKNAYDQENYLLSLELSEAILSKEASKMRLEPLSETYSLMAKSYEKIGNFRDAYIYAQLHKKISDSLYNEEILQVTNTLEAKYRNEQNAKENEILSSKNELQTMQLSKKESERNTILIVALLLLIIAGMFYYLFRTKQKANVKLKELDGLKSNFFANISHELRTPLTIIKGYIDKFSLETTKPNKTNINVLKRNSDRLLKLVNQLLDLSKIDEKRLGVTTTQDDLYKTLRLATTSFNSQAVQRNIEYKVGIPMTPLSCTYDKDKIETIVYNLLGNAFKFSNNGSSISIDVSVKNSTLKITVEDSGIGISKSKLPFVFDRFYQANSTNYQGELGTGIGLALVKELVTLLNGQVSAKSTLNKGSIFMVTVPVFVVQQEEKAINNFKSTGIPKESVIEKRPLNDNLSNLPTVLVVEDNEDMRQFITEQLKDVYHVQEAINGKIGLEMALKVSPQLIITDVMMPEMDGMELCERLKTNINTSHIPIIMLTAKVGIDSKLMGLETGADDYLTKPFNAQELNVRVKNLIQQRERLRASYQTKSFKVDPKAIAVTSIDQRFLEELLELLEEKFSESTFGVLQMQKVLGMSKAQLHRKLKALTNEAPGELLRNFRLKKAKQLIEQNADNISQIAYGVGFNNASYFTQCFKQFFGKSPSSFIVK